ncbi:adenylosuccinate lyase family protein [Streptomyces sp. NPDC002677]|uniref:class-II fumarase/aspartase family protein n=1 Tax=Streptomyces sp. NPDC002677 TaxID=3154774 RepID=UPI003325FDD9
MTTDCRHVRGHITDSHFYGNRYATDASRRIFCDHCRMRRWLEVEAALAAAQAELGVIPSEAARDIGATAREVDLDFDQVRSWMDESRHSLVGLLRAFQAACPGTSGQYIHYGTTTQDIQDTGQALEQRDVLDELDVLLRAMASRLADLADEYAETAALGRTHAVPALPMGFGLKVAGWLDELLRHAERVEQLRPRVLVAQLYGGVGTMAGFGEQAQATVEGFAARLGLGVPRMGWHAARDRMVEYVSVLAMVAGTMGRIADEVRLLSRPEFGELELDWHYGQVGSSTMPHKRNPERCEQIVVTAKLAAAQVGVALAGMAGDHERDSRALRVEWACVPDVSHYALAACEQLRTVLDGLSVVPEQLRANLAATADQVSSERLMLLLGEDIGKQTAHTRVYELTQTARSTGRSVRELLAEHADLAGLLNDSALDEVFDVRTYLGSSARLTHTVTAAARAWLKATDEGTGES